MMDYPAPREFPGMDAQRHRTLERDPTTELTAAEVEAGWHFCLDWDGMLIHEDDDEFKCCSCNLLLPDDYTEEEQ